MPARVAKNWTKSSAMKDSVDSFNLETLNESNLINQLLVFTKDDLTFSVIMELFGSFNGKYLCHPYDTFTVPPGAYHYEDSNGRIRKNTNSFVTTIGIWIFNIVFIRDFGFCEVFDGYINKNLTNKEFENMNQQLVLALLEDKISIENYKKYLNMTQFFMPFETILSPNQTEALLTCTKIINKKKEELATKYKDELDAGNAVIAEKMEKELLDFALDKLKDDPGLDPLLSGAGGDISNNFKNMFIMKGAIRDVDPNAKKEFNIALSNWADGISADEYSIVANSLAGGPYSRSKKTELGGYWEKLLTAAFSTLKIDVPGSDCGTKEYIEVVITDKNFMNYIYNYIITPSGTLDELTTDTKSKYLNKKVKMRFATKCKHKDPTTFCHHCAGNFFYRRSEGKKVNIGTSMAQIASAVKLKSMSAFHNSVVKTSIVDPFKMFGIK